MDALESRGQPLDQSVRAYFEPRFGQDFSRVRLHTDAETARTSREIHARAFTDPFRVGGLDTAAYDQIIGSKRWIIGSPDTVIKDLREVLSVMRPGILAIWTNDGTISHEDSMRCLELMGQEVLPALREIGEELELTGPFDKTT